ncbi:MAG: lipase family protein [Pseudomonadota bacterium]|uniref:lipase family protein n=1 Tax=Gallaecimonas pentaromativorans TaxID=584787 RepID=UPI00067EDD14|nr:lipase family protein [Gallaecimonas pentaromativorans]MED5525646.1 lipase family protein [Pseudomonadota bacterium]
MKKLKALKPYIAAELASIAYETENVGSFGNFNIELSDPLEREFVFDFAQGSIKGISGGFLAQARNKESGFALVGEGIGVNSNSIVIAIRGTNIIRAGDLSADARASLSSTDSGSAVHSGFNSVFMTIKSQLKKVIDRTPAHYTVHCIGHSLGGGIATLVADWIRSYSGHGVVLYTFGSPRVGLTDFSLKLTNKIGFNNIYRAVNSGDIVPAVPVWPFTHIPYNGYEYLLDNDNSINPARHLMKYYTGHVRDVTSWDGIRKRTFIHEKPVYLDIKDAFTSKMDLMTWNKLQNALITLIRECKMDVYKQIQAGIGSGFTLFDRIAMVLSEATLQTPHFEGQITGLLAHMLVFAGKAAVKIKELSFEFIRWVFQQVLNTLNKLVRAALV